MRRTVTKNLRDILSLTKTIATKISMIAVISIGGLSSVPTLHADSGTPSTTIPTQLEWSGPVDRKIEFPNLFVPKEERDKNPEDIKPEIIQQSAALVNRALGSLFRRLVIPVMLEGDAAPHNERIFDLLSREVPGHNFMPAEGVVREALATLYATLYQAYTENPNFDERAELVKIINGKGDVGLTSLSGIGSDVDVLDAGKSAEEDSDLKKATAIINSVRVKLKVDFSRGGINRLLYPLGDVKSYAEQIARGTEQGGNPLDFLAYDLKKDQVVISPRFSSSNSTDTFSQFLRGRLSFAKPLPGVEVDPVVQKVRLMRSVLGAPFLQLDQNSVEELKDLNSGTPDATAKEQMEKGIRSSRFGAAHNMCYRAPEGSPERAFLELSKKTNFPVPEFLERIPIPKTGRPVPDFLKSSMMSPSEVAELTSQTFFHGTPDSGSILSMIRNGFFRRGGTYGAGLYMSLRRKIALDYAKKSNSKNGAVLPIELRNDVPLNIMVSIPEFIRERAKKENVPVFDWISAHYKDLGIDGYFSSSGEFCLYNQSAAKPFILEKSPIFFLLNELEFSDDHVSVEKAKTFVAMMQYFNISSAPGSELMTLFHQIAETSFQAIDSYPKTHDFVGMGSAFRKLNMLHAVLREANQPWTDEIPKLKKALMDVQATLLKIEERKQHPLTQVDYPFLREIRDFSLDENVLNPQFNAFCQKEIIRLVPRPAPFEGVPVSDVIQESFKTADATGMSSSDKAEMIRLSIERLRDPLIRSSEIIGIAEFLDKRIKSGVDGAEASRIPTPVLGSDAQFTISGGRLRSMWLNDHYKKYPQQIPNSRLFWSFIREQIDPSAGLDTTLTRENIDWIFSNATILSDPNFAKVLSDVVSFDEKKKITAFGSPQSEEKVDEFYSGLIAKIPKGREDLRAAFLKTLRAAGAPPKAIVALGGEVPPPETLAKAPPVAKRKYGPEDIPEGAARWLATHEQVYNERIQDDDVFAPIELGDLPAKYDSNNRPVFELGYIEIPKGEALGKTAHLSPTLENGMVVHHEDGSIFYRLFIHPDMEGEYADEIKKYGGLKKGEFLATPTASPRSLLVWWKDHPEKGFFGQKVSLNRTIGGSVRLNNAQKLERSFMSNALMGTIPDKTKKDYGFDFLHEPMTVQAPSKRYGNISRDFSDFEYPGGKPRYVPGLALGTQGPNGEPSILLEQIKKSGLPPEVFLQEKVLKPLIRVYTYLATEEGLVGEFHQQNVLFELDKDGNLTGNLLLRDLDSLNPDVELRNVRGKSNDPIETSGVSHKLLKLDWGPQNYTTGYDDYIRNDWCTYLDHMLSQSELPGAPDLVRKHTLWKISDRLMASELEKHVGSDLVSEASKKLSGKTKFDRSESVLGLNEIMSRFKLQFKLQAHRPSASVENVPGKAGAVLHAIAAEVATGKPNSFRLTTLLDSLPADLTPGEEAELEADKVKFGKITDPIPGYSYIKRSFAGATERTCAFKSLHNSLH
jgi:hypothetical protein